MPKTRNAYVKLYKHEDWSSTVGIMLAPNTPVLVTGNHDSHDGVQQYVMVWAIHGSRLELGWLWTGHIALDTYAETVALRTKYPEQDRSNYKLYYSQRTRFYKNHLITRLEAIQQLLADPCFVEIALRCLEQQAGVIGGGRAKYTKAVDLALAEKEAEWTLGVRLTLRTEPKLKPKTPSPTIVSTSGPLPFQRQFLQEAVKKSVPIKDVGAPVSHGEYAHRIQWYIIAFYFLDAWTPAGLRYIHHAMGRRRFLQLLKQPVRDDDPYRSLWDYVVDVRLNEPGEVGMTRDVMLGSPVRLTSKLLGYDFNSQYKKVELGALATKYKVIARAIANKRRKRSLEEKRRSVGASNLTDDERDQLDDVGGWAARDAWLQDKFPDLFR